jgi:hypothetical protein
VHSKRARLLLFHEVVLHDVLRVVPVDFVAIRVNGSHDSHAFKSERAHGLRANLVTRACGVECGHDFSQKWVKHIARRDGLKLTWSPDQEKLELVEGLQSDGMVVAVCSPSDDLYFPRPRPLRARSVDS